MKLASTESVEIRHATVADIGSILDIQKGDGFGHSYLLSHDRVKQLMDEEEVFYMATIDGEAVGFCCIDFDVRAWIHFFSVLNNYQRQGVGTKMLSHVKQETQDRRLNLLYTIIDQDGKAYQKFLLRNGFQEAGVHRNRFGQGRDGKFWNYFLTSSTI